MNISEEADTKLIKAAKALSMSKSKMVEFLLMKMGEVLGKDVVSTIEEIAVLQEKVSQML